MRTQSPFGRVPSVGKRMIFGCDYNPEQWDESVWLDDVRLMREAGVNFVSVGIFAWSLLEPADGVFDYGLLDRVLDLLHEHEISVDLATGTTAIPAWLSRAHPEVQPVDREGHVLWQGARQNWCASSPIYREKSLRLVETTAKRYANHPALAMWHVNNEFGCHNGRCYCDASAAAFRVWLIERYGDIETLNAAWGTSFWSQRYYSFDEILPPRIAPAWRNPSQELDYSRFSSDIMLVQLRAETDVLRAATPDIPVTTNLMVANFNLLDNWKFAKELDVVSVDHYLEFYPDPHIELAMAADLARGLAGGEPWLLMEHSTSAVNWQWVNIAKQPGEMHRNSLQHIARGADGACFFQWRQSLAGAERFHSAMVPHAGTDSDVWRDVVRLGKHVESMAEVLGSTTRNDVAIILDYSAWWASELRTHPSAEVNYREQAYAYYAACWQLGIGVDFARPGSDLSQYRLVIVPTLYSAAADIVASIDTYVRNGGHALVTFFSGIVDEQDHVIPGGYPGAFRDLLGVRTDQFFPLSVGQAVTLTGSMTATVWTENVRATTAEVVATYVDGPLPGVPAITRNAAGAGVAWYVATQPDRESLEGLVGRVAAEAGVSPDVPTAPGVETVRRHGEDGTSWLFVMNHTNETAHVPVGGVDILSGAEHQAPMQVAAGGVAVVRIPGTLGGRE